MPTPRPAAKKTDAPARKATAKTPTPAKRPGSVVATLVGLPNFAESIVELPVGKVKPDPDNVRRDLGDISELTKSIAEKGVLQPLVVTEDGPGWMIVFGHRRYASAKAAKRSTVPCIVRTFDPLDRLETQVAENLHRADLTPIEEARAYQRLAELGASQRRIRDKVSRSQSHISKRLALLALPERIQVKIEEHELNIVDALELTRLVELPDAGQLISAAAQRAHTYGGMRAAVDETVKKHEQAVARDAARADLVREKVPEVPYRPYGSHSNEYTPIGKGWNELDVAKTRCKTDGTLAGAVAPDGKILYVCTDAKRYMAKVDTKPGETAAQRKARVENERVQAAINDAVATRTGAMCKLVGALSTWKFPSNDIGPLLRILAVAVAKHTDTYAGEAIADIVGLDFDEDDPYNVLDEHMVKGDSELLQVAMATALVACDPGTTWYWTERVPREPEDSPEYDDGGIQIQYAAVIDTLEQLAGYAPSGWELEQLGRTTATPAKTTTARRKAS